MVLDLTLYLVTQSEQLPPSSTLEAVVKAAIANGTTIVQLREKTTDTRLFLSRAIALREICHAAEPPVPLLINDRIDMALACGADGVHLGQDDMPIAEARRLLPKGSIVGVSAGNVEEALTAAKDGADYLGVGACWATESKAVAEHKILGPRGVKKILDALADPGYKTPVVTIGGVGASNIARTLHGCVGSVNTKYPATKPLAGVAVVSAIMAASDPGAASANLSKTIRTFHSSLQSFARPPAPSQSIASIFANLFARLLPPSSKGGLIHHITNTVVQNDCANFTLALRSSPIMSASAAEAEELVQIWPGCLVLNLGTLGTDQVQAMKAAGEAANRRGKGIVCDPVGVGASSLRKREVSKLLDAVQMTIIKGNMGEIASLAGQAGASSRGVDSRGKVDDPARMVRDLARKERCVVAMTGVKDYVSDGSRTFVLENGVEMLSYITGSGCMTGSSIGCFVAAAQALAEEEGQLALTPGLMVAGDMLAAAIGGVTLMNVAAEIAMRKGEVSGPNTFRSALIDSVFNMDAQTLEELSKISEVDMVD